MTYVALFLFAFLCSLNSSPSFALPAPTFRTVALSGMHASGTPSGATYANFNTPSINNSGQVVFFAVLSSQQGGVTAFNDSGIWSEGTGSLELLAREGDPAPSGLTSSIYTGTITGVPNISDSSDVAWLGSFRYTENGSESVGNAIWSGKPGAVAAIATTGIELPGTPSAVQFQSFFNSMINSSGEVGFMAQDSGGIPVNGRALWISSGGGLQSRVRDGDQAPGAPEGATYLFLNGSQLNDAGKMAFFSPLTGGGVTDANSRGIWATTTEGLRLVALSGSHPPGTSDSVQWTLQGITPQINVAGQVAFTSQLLISGEVDITNNAGLWSEGSGSLALVARKGDQAPGTPVGAKFSAFEAPFLANSGSTAFLGRLLQDSTLGIVGNNDEGIWSDAAGSLSLIAREGDQAPDMPSGLVFSSFVSRTRFLTVNSAGHVAFLSNVFNPGLPGRAGIWAQDPNGTLRLVVGTGNLFEVAPGDERMISAVQFQTGSAGGDGLARSFSDQYELAFILRFTDGTSGIFTAQVAVPEPATMVVSVLALILAGRPRRPGLC